MGFFIWGSRLAAKPELIFSAENTVRHLPQDRVNVRQDGMLVATVDRGTAHRLCNENWVQGRMSNSRDKETGVKRLVFKYLILTASKADLRWFLKKPEERRCRPIAEDCNTTMFWIDGYAHNGKGLYYAGGPARLGVVVDC